MRQGATLLAVVAAFAASLAVPATAPAAKDPVLSPVGLMVAEPPIPVLGTDGRRHLAYELLLTNQSDLAVTVESIQALAKGKPIGAAIAGPAVGELMRINGGIDGATIPAGGSATVFADVRYAPKRKAPRRIKHRVRMTGTRPSDPGAAQEFAFTGVPTRVSKRRPVVVQPPLRGPRWVVANGCCSPPNAHRGATLAIDGTVYAPERFAIDYVQLDSENRLFAGPVDENESYPYFGDRIRSATGGRVVGIRENQPEQTPGSLPPGQTVETAGGNYVVVAMGKGRFAFYAHLQPNSVPVQRGDRVRPGQVIGRLGNTGNTDGAHLHFHIMDSPEPLESNGLPFVFDRLRAQGTLPDPGLLQTGQPMAIDRGSFSGVRKRQMPLNDQVMKFR